MGTELMLTNVIDQALQNVYYNKELFPDYDPPKSRSPTPRPEEEHELMEFERGSRDSEESQRTSL